jgi:hypothetical protein
VVYNRLQRLEKTERNMLIILARFPRGHKAISRGNVFKQRFGSALTRG